MELAFAALLFLALGAATIGALRLRDALAAVLALAAMGGLVVTVVSLFLSGVALAWLPAVGLAVTAALSYATSRRAATLGDAARDDAARRERCESAGLWSLVLAVLLAGFGIVVVIAWAMTSSRGI